MSVKNYRFVSPGVFVNEIDNSQLPASPAGQGPVIIGRAEKGPSMRPVTVNSFSEFVNIFGSPVPGGVGRRCVARRQSSFPYVWHVCCTSLPP